MRTKKIANMSPGRILLGSFLLVITIGTILLSLPQARLIDISFIDLLFTATSATCVTGLQVVPMSYFTTFGQCIVLALIQIGGLGLMTLSFFLISLIMNLRLITKLVAGQILEFELYGKIKTFLSLIIGITFLSELAGAITLYFPFSKIFSTKQAIFHSIFHSISAFCNAGTCLLESNMTSYIKQPAILIPISMLIFLGGIGFIVWYEIGNHLFNKMKRNRQEGGEPKKVTYSLHTRIVLLTSVILIVLGALFFLLLERNNTLQELTTFEKIINSFFMSITTRTAGFNTANVAHMALPTLFIFIILMFVGTSPNSTGSGIKTTTFTIFLSSIASFAKNKSSVEILGRKIPSNQIYKTTVIVALALSWIGITTFALLLTDKGFSFIQILFESVSAFSTSGLSTGITPYLSQLGKASLIITMIIGRIGSLTLVLALTTKKEVQLYSYPEERVIIG
jgi:trk system potassium uptake protein TrkH